MTLNTLDKNQDKEKASHDNNSEENLFEEECQASLKSQKVEKQPSALFDEYSKFLSGVSVKDCLTKYSSSLKASKISFNECCFQQEMSLVIIQYTKNYEIVTLFVSFSHFSFQVSVLSLNESSLAQTHIQNLGQGAYGKIYQTKINDQIMAIKNIQFSSPVDRIQKQKINNRKAIQASNTISKAIFQYCLYKLLSVFEIGPKVINIFGFDLLIYKDSIQFSMQKCQKGYNKSKQSLYYSLDLMHSLKIIHGDIKQENIMWSNSFNKWVFIDFGFSQVLSEKPGEKTLTKYFGTFIHSSQQMRSLYYSTKMGYVDLYYNDLYGLQTSLEQIYILQKEVLKPEKVNSPKTYINFVQSIKLCYVLCFYDNDAFSKFCLQINKALLLLDYFWETIKILVPTYRLITRLNRLSDIILINENRIQSYLIYKKQEQSKQKQAINFSWRFQQRVHQFNGAINDTMLFSFIYFNFDISPNRYVEKQTTLKNLLSKFDPSDQNNWKDFIKLMKNPYTLLFEVVNVFEIVRKAIGIENWIEVQVKKHQFLTKGRQICSVCIENRQPKRKKSQGSRKEFKLICFPVLIL